MAERSIPIPILRMARPSRLVACASCAPSITSHHIGPRCFSPMLEEQVRRSSESLCHGADKRMVKTLLDARPAVAYRISSSLCLSPVQCLALLSYLNTQPDHLPFSPGPCLCLPSHVYATFGCARQCSLSAQGSAPRHQPVRCVWPESWNLQELCSARPRHRAVGGQCISESRHGQQGCFNSNHYDHL